MRDPPLTADAIAERAAKATPSNLARRVRGLSDAAIAWAFIAPTVALLLAINIFPLIWTIRLPFTNYQANRPNRPVQNVGARWYEDMLGSADVWAAMQATAHFVFWTILLQTLIGFALAYLIERKFKGHAFWTTVILVPMMLSPAVVGNFWKFLYRPQIGLFNTVVSFFTDIPPSSFEMIGSVTLAPWSIIIVDTWMWTPYVMLICLAGLRSIPDYIYEAAEVDRASQRDIAYVFQLFALYPHMDMRRNIAFPLLCQGVAQSEIRTRVEETARLLRIDHLLDRPVSGLAGGDRQRVALGRAIVRRPMDEPLSSLDARLRGELRLELKRIQEELGATILYVTHDQIEAMTMANRIGVISQGRLIQTGSPRAIYENPASVYVAQRLGSPQINLLPAGLIANGRLPTGAATVGARTEHLRITRAKTGAAMVEWVEHLGDQNHLHLKLDDRRITTLTAPDTEFEAGDRVSLALDKPLYFDAAGNRVRE